MFLEYLLSQKKANGTLPKNGAILKTIVTSEIGRVIADAYDVETFDTLTGFKFIGEKILEFEQRSDYSFLFGYEESYGYLIGDFVRDKDAIQAAVFACEVALHYKKQGKSLYEALMDIFEKYGYFFEDLQSITLKGIEGANQIQDLMTQFRENRPTNVAGINVKAIEDYQSGEQINVEDGLKHKLSLPSSNVLKYHLQDGSWFCLRPSGTEPKMKLYFGVKGTSVSDSQSRIHAMKADLNEKISAIIKIKRPECT